MAVVPANDLPNSLKGQAVPESDLPGTEPKKVALKDQPLTFKEKLNRIWGETKGGAVLGALSPEITQGIGYGTMLGGAALGQPEAIPAGEFIVELGTGMKAHRLAEAGMGALGGAAGETAAQLTEQLGGGKISQEAFRFAAGGLTPAATHFLGAATMSLVGKVAGAKTGTALIRDVENLLQLPKESLSEKQKQYVLKIAEKIQSRRPSKEAGEVVLGTLEKGARDAQQQYQTQAQALERQADDLIKAANDAAQSGSAQANKRVDDLYRQFNNDAERIRSVARERAKTEGQQVLKDAERQITRLKDIADKARRTAASRSTFGYKELEKIVPAKTPTQIGNEVRNSVLPRLEQLKKIRASNAEKYKGEAFKKAEAFEKSGIYPKNTKSFKTATDAIDKMIKDSPQLSSLRAPLENIKRALNPVKILENGTQVSGPPITFEGLEKLRRFMRDRAGGLPAEGYDAMSQIEAGKIADMIENIQKDFSPGITKFLEQYKIDSKPINDFRTKVGRAIAEQEDFDMGRMVTDPADIASRIFKTERGVRDLEAILGSENFGKSETLARSYAGDKLRGATSGEVRNFVNKTARDWIDRFPKLKEELLSAAERMETSERIISKREKLSKTLRTEAVGISPQELARKFREAVLEKAEKRITGAAPAVTEQAGRIIKESEESGRIGVSEAKEKARELRGQAGKLTAEGQRIADQIVGKKLGQARIEDIIQTHDIQLWKQVAPIIKSDPEARRAFADVVRNMIAETGKKSPAGIVRKYKVDIEPLLSEFGIMEPKELQKLSSQVDELGKAVEPEKQMTALQRLVVNAIRSESARILFTPARSEHYIPEDRR